MNIYEKIHAISVECPPIEKLNQTDGNKWVSADEVKRVLNPIMQNYGIISYMRDSRIDAHGVNRMVYCTFEYVDTDSQESISVTVPYEIGDKDLTGNAITLCAKYADIQTFRIRVIEEADGDKIKAPATPADKAADKVAAASKKAKDESNSLGVYIHKAMDDKLKKWEDEEFLLTQNLESRIDGIANENSGEPIEVPRGILNRISTEKVASPTPPCIGHDKATEEEEETLVSLHPEWEKTVLDVKMLGIKVDDCYELKRINIDLRNYLKQNKMKFSQKLKFELVAAVRLDILPNYMSLELGIHDYDFNYFTNPIMENFMYSGKDGIETRGVCPTVEERKVKEVYDMLFAYLFGMPGVFKSLDSFQEYLCAMNVPMDEEKNWTDVRDFIKFATFVQLDEVISNYSESLKHV